MLIDFSKVADRQDEPLMLRLQTLAGTELGVIPNAYNIETEIMLSEVSTIRFEVPKQSNGAINAIYSQIGSYKVVYTEHYGIYILTSPVVSGDGMQEVKTVTGYSLEKLFEKKRLILEEGTYNFYDDIAPEETILGRVAALNPAWHIGYVDPELKNVYRTFDQYDQDALSFCYGDAMEKYNCVIVFDVYNKTINAWSAAKNRDTLPIYLSYDNLIEEANIEEVSDNIVTKLHPYGSDELTIREVNPIGADYIINLSYFIQNGDLDIVPKGSSVKLSERVQSWQKLVLERQAYYTGLIAAYSAKTSEKLFEENKLTELRGEVETLTVQQSVTIQALALEKTAEGKQNRQAELAEITAQINVKKTEISEQEEVIASIRADAGDIYGDITAVNGELAMENYFSTSEMAVLEQFLIEGDLTEETFVATEIDVNSKPASMEVEGDINIFGSDIQRVELTDYSKNMFAITGGAINIESADIMGVIIRATIEQDEARKSFLLTAYLSEVGFGSNIFGSGLLTINGEYADFNSDISSKNEGGLVLDKGTGVVLESAKSTLFFTVNVSEYHRFSVAQELYDFAMTAMEDLAWPIYEFSLNSANFIYQDNFKPFKDKLELGKGIYLNFGDGTIIQANLIGVSLNFDDPTNFGLIFSNQFKRKNGAEALRTTIKDAAMSSRSFDLSKYTYNKTVSQQSRVSEFMSGMLDAAVNNILGANNQSVVIDGAGIHIGGDSNYQLRLVDNMIAMTDDGWGSAKLALGRFAADEIGEVWGVNTELLAGKISIAETLIIESESDTGVKQFRVDPTGAWLYNAQFVLQDEGGLLIIDPTLGIAAGTELMFNTNGTTVTPAFLDDMGEIEFDNDGMPVNSNFFLDIRDGNAYFRGKVIATSGKFSGELEAATGSFTGSLNIGNGNFVVDSNGNLTAKSGTFYGTVRGAKFLDSNGNEMMSDGKWNSEYLDLGNIQIDGNTGDITMTGSIDMGGDINMDGNITLGGNIVLGGSITWSSDNSPTKVLYARTKLSKPTAAYSTYPASSTTGWHKTLNSASDIYASYSYDGGSTWTDAVKIQGEDGSDGADGPSEAEVRTIITDTLVSSPTIRGGSFEDLNGDVYLVLDPTGDGYGDLKFMRRQASGDLSVFSIHDGVGGASMYIYGAKILSASNIDGAYVAPHGEWNFSNATVTGITAVFA